MFQPQRRRRTRFVTVTLGFGAMLMVCASYAAAARLVDHGPITDKVYMLWFRDGQYNHSNLTTWSSVAWQEKLDTATARQTATYSITSSDDADFAGGKPPAAVGRKSKGSDFRGLGNAEYFQDHWMFLELPSKLKRGKSYTISMGGLGSNVSFTFDEFEQRNEAIHVSHYGYSPRATIKHAYISMYLGDFGPLELDNRQGTAFHIVKDNGSNETVYSGTIAKRKDLETDGPDYYPDCPGRWREWFKNQYASYTMADVWECEFSDFAGVPGYNGKYKIVVEGMGCSYNFGISTDVYNRAWKDCMLGIYHQRCGIPLESEYTEWTRPACHRITLHQATVPGENGAEAPAPTTGEIYTNIWGGYHDACDHDKWISHMLVPRNLCLAYELRPTIFTDGELSIPENDNGVPDILDEAAWAVAYFMRMQQDDGGVRGTSWTADGKWYVGPAQADASLTYSVVANQLAYCLQLAGVDEIAGPYYTDVDLSRTNLLATAKKAYDWGMAKGYTPDHGPQLLYEAYAWMYKVTGDATYQTAYKTDNPITAPTISLFAEYCATSTNPYSQEGKWNMQFAVSTYLTTDHPNVDQTYQAMQKQAYLNWATYDRLEIARDYRGFRLGHHRRMPPLCGVHTSPDAFLQAVAGFALTNHEQQWLDLIYPGNDYCLGGNELNMCFISQCGHRYPKEIMHSTTWTHPKGCAKGIIPYGSWTIDIIHSVNSIQGGFAARTCYPLYVNWGQFELFWENRYLASGNEFTVPQTNGLAAFSYAIVKDGGPDQVSVNGDRRERTVETLVHAPRVSVTRRDGAIALTFSARAMRTIRLLDISGRCVHQYAGDARQVTIPATLLGGGCYVVKVADTEKTTAAQVTVLK